MLELDALYKKISEGDSKEFLSLLELQSFFITLSKFDSVNNKPLLTTFDDVVYNVRANDWQKKIWWNDRLQNILNYSFEAIHHIIEFLHEKNIREYHVNQPSKIREIDSKCINWLSRKPGFSIRQKIAATNRMMGVYHRTSLDTSENRLFKFFLKRLDLILIEKVTAAESLQLIIPSSILSQINTVHKWLYSEECDIIRSWDSVPPNNTLLNDKYYRKIWNAWQSLQKLSQQMQQDLEHLPEIRCSAYFWILMGILEHKSNYHFRQCLVCLDYGELRFVGLDRFSKPNPNKNYFQNIAYLNIKEKNWFKFREAGNKLLYYRADDGNDILTHTFEIEDGDCDVKDLLRIAKKTVVRYQLKHSDPNLEKTGKIIIAHIKGSFSALDINSITPYYANANKHKGLLKNRLIAQVVYESDGPHAFLCNQAKLLWKGIDSDFFTIHDVFKDYLEDEENNRRNFVLQNQVCDLFAQTMRREVNNDKCIFVVDDGIEDFSPNVQCFKRSIKNNFSHGVIIPRSIAVAFYNYDIVLKMKHNDEFYVIDKLGPYSIKTKIQVVINDDLLKKNPETKGIQLLRYPSERIANELSSTLNITYFDALNIDGKIFCATETDYPKVKTLGQDVSSLCGNNDLNNFVVSKDENYAESALKFKTLQDKSPDISLWGDVLPPLSMVDITEKEYKLVEVGKGKIFQSQGPSVDIPITWGFEFSAGKDFFEFPLIQNGKRGCFFAYIKHPAFPLKQETKCKLKLTYSYGEENPYKLEFIPVNPAEFKSVTVHWETKSHKDLLHLPIPVLGKVHSWKDLEHYESDKPKSKDIIEWIENEYIQIKRMGIYKIASDRDNDRKTRDGKFVYDVLLKDKYYPAFIDSRIRVKKTDKIWCIVNPSEKNGKSLRCPIILNNCKNQECCFKKSLRYPAITIWSGGRSIEDEECPKNFREKTNDVLNDLEKWFKRTLPEQVEEELSLFLACMHKDAPKWFCIDKLNCMMVKLGENKIGPYKDMLYTRMIAYALGDCSQMWQKNILKDVLLWLQNKDNTIRIKSIRILAIALWRNDNFPYVLKIDDINVLLSVIKRDLNAMLVPDYLEMNPLWDKKSEKKYERNKSKKFNDFYECILGICRLRNPKIGQDNLEYLKVLSPYVNSEIKDIVKTLKKSQEFYKPIKSFLNIKLKDGENGVIPALLYAAIGFSSGSIDSNSIRVDTNFSNDDNENE